TARYTAICKRLPSPTEARSKPCRRGRFLRSKGEQSHGAALLGCNFGGTSPYGGGGCAATSRVQAHQWPSRSERAVGIRGGSAGGRDQAPSRRENQRQAGGFE